MPSKLKTVFPFIYGEYTRIITLPVILCLLPSIPISAQADGFEVGASVRCKWQRIGNYYPGTIARREGDTLYIDYDDGDKETTEVRYCQLYDRNQSNRVNNNTDDTNQNAAGESRIIKLESRSSNDWRQWSIQLSNGTGRLTADGHGQHMNWEIELPRQDVEILTCIQGSQWWTKWQYRYGSNQLIAEASSRTEWKIDSVYNRLKVTTRWSNDTDQWVVEGRKGSMKINRTGGSWAAWTIEDNMPGEDFHMKMAAIFAVIVATDMPHS